MPFSERRLIWHGLAVVLTILSSTVLMAQENLAQIEQQAIQQAVASADPSIVRIETVGGLDVVDKILIGAGPTSGVVVREDGYIITSRFNFLSQPASVLVTLPDERRFAAEIVSHDMLKMLTLLKIDASGLTPVTAVPKSEFQVGQWAIALGRTFDLKFPNLSVGIISALNRVWGRAIQTDARTSPVNYGGALIDITGRCLGIIVPLSPDDQSETAGVEWYDSGIGFAIPLEDVQQVLDRLIAGETLKPGLMGLGFEDAGPVSVEPKVIRVRPESPADQAGIQQDDVITAADGRAVRTVNELKHLLGGKYAGDPLALTLQRQEASIEAMLTLTDALIAYEFPYLGVLPARPIGAKSPVGVTIRQVLEGSPAQAAGLLAGDVIQQIQDSPVATREELASQLWRQDIGATVPLQILRQGEPRAIDVTLARLPDEIPATVPAIARPTASSASTETPTGRLNEQAPGDGLSFWAYVPENYTPETAWGLVVWLHPSTDAMEAQMLRHWTSLCDERGLILVGPRAADVSGWGADDEQGIRTVIDWIEERYRLDPDRTCVIGRADAGVMAARLAFKDRERFRGLVLIDTPLLVEPPDNDPDAPLQFAFAALAENPERAAIDQAILALRERKFPVASIETPESQPGAIGLDDSQSLIRWLDSLDRL